MEHNQITVAQAAKEYSLKPHNIRRWIDLENITAEKGIDGQWTINKSSLLEYLTRKKLSKTQTEDSASEPLSNSDALRASQTTEAAVQSKTICPPPDLWKEEKKESDKNDVHVHTSTKIQTPHPEETPGVKRQEKLNVLGLKKGRKKAAVRYAKDSMRHLSVAELFDVSRWLSKRIEDRLPKHEGAR